MLNFEALGRYARYRAKFLIYGVGSTLATRAYLRFPKRHSEAHEHRNVVAHELDLLHRKFRVLAMKNWHWSENAKAEVIEGVDADR